MEMQVSVKPIVIISDKKEITKDGKLSRTIKYIDADLSIKEVTDFTLSPKFFIPHYAAISNSGWIETHPPQSIRDAARVLYEKWLSTK